MIAAVCTLDITYLSLLQGGRCRLEWRAGVIAHHPLKHDSGWPDHHGGARVRDIRFAALSYSVSIQARLSPGYLVSLVFCVIAVCIGSFPARANCRPGHFQSKLRFDFIASVPRFAHTMKRVNIPVMRVHDQI